MSRGASKSSSTAHANSEHVHAQLEVDADEQLTLDERACSIWKYSKRLLPRSSSEMIHTIRHAL